MTTRGPANIYSGEILPVAPETKNVELDVFNRKLLDYLRRLVGKLSRFSGSTASVPVFAASMTVDRNPGVISYVVEWDSEIRKDSIYSISSSKQIITVAETGLYSVEVDIAINKNFQTGIDVAKVDSGGNVLSTEDYLKSKINDPTLGHTYSYMVPIALTAGESLSIIVYSIDMVNLVEVLKLGTRILISKIGDAQ